MGSCICVYMSEMRHKLIPEDALKVFNVVGFNLWSYRQANIKHSVFKSNKMDLAVFVTGGDMAIQELQIRVSVLQCQHVASL